MRPAAGGYHREVFNTSPPTPAGTCFSVQGPHPRQGDRNRRAPHFLRHHLAAPSLPRMSVLSGKALQAQVDDLAALCPVLLPSIVPKGYQDEDLLRMCTSEGDRERLEEALSEAASTSRPSCCVCAAPGQAAMPSTACQEDEARVLRFTTFPRVSFAEKSIHMSRAGFACGQCRALAETWQFVRFSASKLGAHKPEREELMKQLCLHFAAVNKVSDEMMANVDIVVAWVQEIFSRAYGLHVVASNIAGWKVVGPDGAAIQRVGAETAAQLAKTLLQAKKLKQKKAATQRAPPPVRQDESEEQALPVKAEKKKKRKMNDDAPVVNGKGPVLPRPKEKRAREQAHTELASQKKSKPATVGIKGVVKKKKKSMK